MVSNLAFVVAGRKGWTPPVIPTSAVEGTGVAKLADALDRHRAHLAASGELGRRERERARKELFEAVRRAVAERVDAGNATSKRAEDLVEAIVARKKDPRRAAAELLRAMRLG